LCYDYIRKKYKMKNIPRIFIGNNVCTNVHLPAPRDTAHYLMRVMRQHEFIAFGGGREYNATLSDDGREIIIGAPTDRSDPSGNITLMFAPIKRTDDLINMATQIGVARFQPVVTARTVAPHVNWDRMRRIAVEAAEQSNRNSVPEIMNPIRFSDLDLSAVTFADERAAHGRNVSTRAAADAVLVGPEGGFSDDEFAALDAAGARGISLGKTILRAELAGVIAVTKVMP